MIMHAHTAPSRTTTIAKVPDLFLAACFFIAAALAVFCLIGCGTTQPDGGAIFRTSNRQVGHATTNYFDRLVRAELAAVQVKQTNVQLYLERNSQLLRSKGAAYVAISSYQEAASNTVFSALGKGVPDPVALHNLLVAKTNVLEKLRTP